MPEERAAIPLGEKRPGRQLREDQLELRPDVRRQLSACPGRPCPYPVTGFGRACVGFRPRTQNPSACGPSVRSRIPPLSGRPCMWAFFVFQSRPRLTPVMATDCQPGLRGVHGHVRRRRVPWAHLRRPTGANLCGTPVAYTSTSRNAGPMSADNSVPAPATIQKPRKKRGFTLGKQTSFGLSAHGLPTKRGSACVRSARTGKNWRPSGMERDGAVVRIERPRRLNGTRF